jgi:hypothetical protein
MTQNTQNPGVIAARIVLAHPNPARISCANIRSATDRLRSRGFDRIHCAGVGSKEWLIAPRSDQRFTAVARWQEGALYIWGAIPKPSQPRRSGAELGPYENARLPRAVWDAICHALNADRSDNRGVGTALRAWYENTREES